jgi:hypothetical protein
LYARTWNSTPRAFSARRRTAAEDVLSVARQIRTTLGEVAQGDPPQREAGRAVVVYGGQARQARSDVLVLPWDELDRESWFL